MDQQEQQMEVDFEAVMASMSNQVTNLSRECAIKDGVIARLKAQNDELRQAVDSLSNDKKQDATKKGAKDA